MAAVNILPFYRMRLSKNVHAGIQGRHLTLMPHECTCPVGQSCEMVSSAKDDKKTEQTKNSIPQNSAAKTKDKKFRLMLHYIILISSMPTSTPVNGQFNHYMSWVLTLNYSLKTKLTQSK